MKSRRELNRQFSSCRLFLALLRQSRHCHMIAGLPIPEITLLMISTSILPIRTSLLSERADCIRDLSTSMFRIRLSLPHVFGFREDDIPVVSVECLNRSVVLDETVRRYRRTSCATIDDHPRMNDGHIRNVSNTDISPAILSLPSDQTISAQFDTLLELDALCTRRLGS